MSELALYNYFRSSTSYRVRIALELKGLYYEYRPVHLLNNGGEQNSAFYRALNPVGGVPTLMHGEKVVSQSLPIVEYLEEISPRTIHLFPEDPFLKAKVRQFCEIINSDIHPLQNLKVLQQLEKQYGFTADQKTEWVKKWVMDGLTALEKVMQPFASTYCFGEKITTADAFLIPQLFSAQRFGVDISGFKELVRINENCLKNPAFMRAHPYRQIDTPDDLKI